MPNIDYDISYLDQIKGISGALKDRFNQIKKVLEFLIEHASPCDDPICIREGTGHPDYTVEYNGKLTNLSEVIKEIEKEFLFEKKEVLKDA